MRQGLNRTNSTTNIEYRIGIAKPGRVQSAGQNHGFAVDESSLPENVVTTHRSLFDATLQGIAFTDKPAYSFQGHPEASPGPHDLLPLFERFIHHMDEQKKSGFKAMTKK